MQLSRESISRAALEILDDYGLADVTMRRVAKSLGVAPGALYWHIENKQELISGVASLVISPLDSSGRDTSHPDTSWPTSATEGNSRAFRTEFCATFCAELCEVLLRHRDGAEVVMSAMAHPNSPVNEKLGALMFHAVSREVDQAGARASISEQRSVAEGLLYMTLGAATVHQASAQLAEATGATPQADGFPVADVSPAISLLVAGLRSHNA